MASILLITESKGFFEQLFEFIQPETLMCWEFWLVASALLVVAEFLTMGFLLGAFVPGTLLSATLAAFGVGMNGQLWGFIFGTMVGLFILRPTIVRHAKKGGIPSNVDALVGVSAMVTEPITPSSSGRVKIRGEEWRAAADSEIQVGVSVTVVRIDGNSVRVQAQN
jgi:membrane protein implicated in regulation of membrane protease activity